MATLPYSPGDVTRSHAWLHHNGGYTEVTILHPDYKPGEHAWNRERQAWPITRYLQSTAELLHIVRQYAGERMICYGLNPRPAILHREDGRVRSAKEADITISQTLLLDIDLQGAVTPERLDNLRRFLYRADEYIRSKGLQRPVRAKTTKGSHLLFAYEPITVAERPDIRGQLRTFKEEFQQAHRRDLCRLEAHVDSTQDLRRIVRVYGTPKPGIDIVSCFYGACERKPDAALRHYLLHLPPHQRRLTDPLPSITAAVLPAWFEQRLRNDPLLNELWHGRGKPPGTDQSNSGYDYTIAAYLAKHGDCSNDDIATIIALRPTGAAARASKGIEYLLRTISAARC